jgi:hypothetical protein
MKTLIYLLFICVLFSACSREKTDETEKVELTSKKDKTEIIVQSNPATKEIEELKVLIKLEGYDLVQIDYNYTCVPDSLLSEMAKFIIETVSAASLHMTGGDYENPENVIFQAEKTANKIFSRRATALKMWNQEEYAIKITIKDLTPRQTRIYELVSKYGPIK